MFWYFYHIEAQPITCDYGSVNFWYISFIIWYPYYWGFQMKCKEQMWLKRKGFLIKMLMYYTTIANICTLVALKKPWLQMWMSNMGSWGSSEISIEDINMRQEKLAVCCVSSF